MELGTKETFETAYTLPVPLLCKLAENLIVKANEREESTLLENMKDQIES